jgi:hypothetical protein
MYVIPALGRLRQEPSLGFTEKPCLKKRKQKGIVTG